MEVTLELPDQLYEQAKQWAAITEQDLDTTLTEALTVVLAPVHTAPELDEPVTSLSDEQVLEQSEMRMAPSQGQRLSLLLAKRREGSLTEEGAAGALCSIPDVPASVVAPGGSAV